jgi:RNA polymerase sigma-70 factor, ECF subfamily
VAVLDEKLVARFYAAAKAERWNLPASRFRHALEASVARAFAGGDPSAREADRYLSSLHLEDLALACACAEGHEAAWETFIRELRPVLYRSADALDPGGGARELADSLYGELYERALFRYFHGRSSLATWLRSVLAQRHVDRVRARKRLEPLPDEEVVAVAVGGAPAATAPTDRSAMTTFQSAVEDAVKSLAARDRLRLRCYYAQQLTLAQTGRLLGEHEATVSRQLARSRKHLRAAIETVLRNDRGWTQADIASWAARTSDDAGELDLSRLLAEPFDSAQGRPEARKLSDAGSFSGKDG